MNLRPTTRATTRRIALIFSAVVVLGCVAIAFSGRRPIRTFRLHFQLADFVVPAGETWRLSWKSPYHAGDICPVYDVRVIEGDVRLGAKGAIEASTYDTHPGKTGILDLRATRDEAIAWLEPCTKFNVANECLGIEVSVFAVRQ
jgi:hypothetical protein